MLGTLKVRRLVYIRLVTQSVPSVYLLPACLLSALGLHGCFEFYLADVYLSCHLINGTLDLINTPGATPPRQSIRDPTPLSLLPSPPGTMAMSLTLPLFSDKENHCLWSQLLEQSSKLKR